MNLKEYIPLALRTRGEFDNKKFAIAYWTLGIIGEYNELEEAYIMNNYPLVGKEAGDVIWYIVALANELELPIEGIEPFIDVPAIPMALAEIIKKHLGHGKDIDRNEFATYLCQIMVSCYNMAFEAGYSKEKVLRMNIDKLKLRYPKGFSVEASKNRPLEN